MKIIEVIVYGSYFVSTVCFTFLLKSFGLSNVIAIPLGLVCGVASVLLGFFLISELINRTGI